MLTIHDQFCGAGGSSLGAKAVEGVELVLAMNHDKIAIETHGNNFPEADHACVDVACVDPRWYPPADILITSPECRAHSYARGRKKNDPSLFDPKGDLTAERSRATMWDVPRFAEVHDYKVVIVENVTQAVEWGPKHNKGSQFRAWLYAMDGLGYDHKLVSYNSMFAPPTPQSRDRMYVVFWKKSQKVPNLDFTVPAWCGGCGTLVHGVQQFKKLNPHVRQYVGRFGQQYTYVCPDCSAQVSPVVTPAASAIDWDLKAQRIGDRKRPLKDATVERIQRGLERLNERPMIVAVGGNLFERPGYSRTWATDGPMPVVTTTLDRALVEIPGGLVVPVKHGKYSESRKARDVAEPMPTQTAQAEYGVAMVDLRRNGRERLPDEPLSTVLASGNHHGIVIANYGPGGGKARKGPGGWWRVAEREPIGSITTTDCHSLVVPYRKGTGKEVTEPLPTATSVDPYALVDGAAPAVAVEDCGFRMLEPHEIARAMVMHEHVDGTEYKVVGNKRQKVKQYGNAVTPPVMQMILSRCVESLDE